MTRKEIGKIVKKRRKELKMSVYRVTKNSGLTNQQVIAIEEASKAYTADSLFLIITALDLKINISEIELLT